MRRVAFTLAEYYPVYEPVLNPTDPENGFTESAIVEVDDELLDRWARAKAEFYAVQEIFEELDK